MALELETLLTLFLLLGSGALVLRIFGSTLRMALKLLFGAGSIILMLCIFNLFL